LPEDSPELEKIRGSMEEQKKASEFLQEEWQKKRDKKHQLADYRSFFLGWPHFEGTVSLLIKIYQD